MPTLNLLYQHEFKINDQISVVVPTVGQILDDEDNYYSLLSVFTGTPIDYMVPLDEVGIDFTQITDFDLFLIMLPGLLEKDLSLILGDLDLRKFRIGRNDKNNLTILADTETGVVIDKAIHAKIASALRKMHHLERNRRTPANEETRKYMLQRAREKMKRKRNRSEESQLESLIVSMVNTEQFKYNYETVKDLTIYQFNESVRQVAHKIRYDNIMRGVYAGTVDPKGLKQEELNWLSHK